MIISDDATVSGMAAAGPAITVDLRWIGDLPLVEVAGEVDLLTAPQFEETVLAALDERPAALVIDLLAVRFFGSAGLAVLIAARRHAEGRTEIRLVAGGATTLRALQATGLAGEFTLCESSTDALGRPTGG